MNQHQYQKAPNNKRTNKIFKIHATEFLVLSTDKMKFDLQVFLLTKELWISFRHPSLLVSKLSKSKAFRGHHLSFILPEPTKSFIHCLFTYYYHSIIIIHLHFRKYFDIRLQRPVSTSTQF